MRSWSARNPDAAVVGDGDGVVMPGMVNAHTHLTECLIPGMGEDAGLFEWFERVVNPVGRVITARRSRWGPTEGGGDAARGITTVNDMSCHRNMGSLATLGAVDGLAGRGCAGVSLRRRGHLRRGSRGRSAFIAEHEALAERTAAEPLIGFRCGVGTVLGLSDRSSSAPSPPAASTGGRSTPISPRSARR